MSSNELDNDIISIQFECGEDATNFELKKLDKSYMDTFHRLDTSASSQAMLDVIKNYSKSSRGTDTIY